MKPLPHRQGSAARSSPPVRSIAARQAAGANDRASTRDRADRWMRFSVQLAGLSRSYPNRTHASSSHCRALAASSPARAQAVYGQPSAVNRLLVLNAEPQPGRGTVLLLREAIGFRMMHK